MDLDLLSKATILNTQSGEAIPVMYNPEEFRLEQGNNFAEVGIPGLEAPPIQYVRGRARVLTMELFFDTYERGEDVRVHTGRIVALLDQIPQTHAPPILLFTMGQFSFECVLVEAGQRFTMFARDGTPVRATLSTRFQEFVRAEFEVERGLFVGPPTLHNIGSSQTVASITADYLGDPRRWREIAEANDIDDPLNLPPGQSLVVPGGVPS
jgi:hypothetical protein